MPLRAVIFDLFDTLVDLRWENLPMTEHNGKKMPASTRVLHEIASEGNAISFDDFVDALAEGGRAFAESHFANDRELPTLDRFRDLAQRLGVRDPELPARLTDVHMESLRRGVVAPSHHLSVLEELGRHVRLGLCSNFSHSETALGILDETGLREPLDPNALVVSDAFGLRKPRAEIFEEVLRRLEVDVDEALHVGDSLRADVGGAVPLGLRTAWITRRIRDPEEALAKHAGPRPDHVIGDLGELAPLVASLR